MCTEHRFFDTKGLHILTDNRGCRASGTGIKGVDFFPLNDRFKFDELGGHIDISRFVGLLGDDDLDPFCFPKVLEILCQTLSQRNCGWEDQDLFIIPRQTQIH